MMTTTTRVKAPADFPLTAALRAERDALAERLFVEAFGNAGVWGPGPLDLGAVGVAHNVFKVAEVFIRVREVHYRPRPVALAGDKAA